MRLLFHLSASFDYKKKFISKIFCIHFQLLIKSIGNSEIENNTIQSVWYSLFFSFSFPVGKCRQFIHGITNDQYGSNISRWFSLVYALHSAHGTKCLMKQFAFSIQSAPFFDYRIRNIIRNVYVYIVDSLNPNTRNWNLYTTILETKTGFNLFISMFYTFTFYIF